MHCGPLVVSVVPSLPRGAAVELHVTAVQDDPTERIFSQTTTQVPGAILSCQLVQASNGHSATLSLAVRTSSDSAEPEVVLKAISSAFQDSVKKLDRQLSPLCCRAFFKLSTAVGQQLAAGRPITPFLIYLFFLSPLSGLESSKQPQESFVIIGN